MNIKKYIAIMFSLAAVGAFALAIPAFAETNSGLGDLTRMRPNVVGKVSAISGNTLTVISNQGFYKNAPAAATTLTVNATNAKVLRGETVSAVSSIAVGDTVIIQGTVTGTNVVATVIRDGKMGNGNKDENNQALLQIQGNGQPVVAGTVASISGNIITITNKSNITYTVDAASAKFFVTGVANPTISNVSAGDNLIVQGTVNGTSVTASFVIDQKAKTNNGVGNSNNNGKPNVGFMGRIGNFFKHLFGF